MPENEKPIEPIADIHMHIVPGVDDGSGSMAESIAILKQSVKQGVGTIIVTPHSWAIEECGLDFALSRFNDLKKAAREQHIPVDFYFGCEMLVFPSTVDMCIGELDDGRYPTLAGSRYVLTEFIPTFSQNEMELCIYKIVAAHYVPVIAHAERYTNSTVEGIKALRRLGALVQINAFSIVNEKKDSTRNLANALLSEKLVDFIGSDAHRLDHRPPVISDGLVALSNRYSGEYVRKITVRNVKDLILKN